MYIADKTIMNLRSSIISEIQKQSIEFKHCHDNTAGPEFGPKSPNKAIELKALS